MLKAHADEGTGTGTETDDTGTSDTAKKKPLLHRAEATSCVNVHSPPEPREDAEGDCKRHADCTEGANGKCVGGTRMNWNHHWCVYDSCETDAASRPSNRLGHKPSRLQEKNSTDNVLQLAERYQNDAAFRRKILESSLVNKNSGYAKTRLAKYNDKEWGSLPIADFMTRPITPSELGAFVPTAPGEADTERMVLSMIAY